MIDFNAWIFSKTGMTVRKGWTSSVMALAIR